MNIPADLLPFWLMVPALVVFLGLFAWQVWGSGWQLLLVNRLEWVYVLAIGLLTGLWWLKAEAVAGLQLHFLGLSAMVLVFGWRLSMVGGALALGLLTAAGVYDWWALGVNGLITVALPVLLADRLHALVYFWFPKHYFVYVIVAAHFTSMIVIVATMLTGALLLWLLGVYPWSRISYDYLVFIPVAMLPEGFINGAIMTMLTAFKPEWVRSFDDRDYIEGK
ncbi:energy-coupling factor ABC transporter permease [Wenzhouxiangella marina]|uniref:Putative integral membrane protein n=1 Tax=Wenzhouxiangella marina TaxID=1579979 RepID=A0A0K0XZX7_9GAMM|nr:energy-coupling factor ABC transporter permease [Wenzhouxiangella marina]AKS43234.1 Putative integral membrane protein [Wenzhouxiangella marina]MBB6087079.1 putative membrane protein [Wenzhouxiangella marina]